MTEYKVVELERKISMSKMCELLQSVLNEHAKLGWKLKVLEGPFVVLEKD